jgi:hypothetical protein
MQIIGIMLRYATSDIRISVENHRENSVRTAVTLPIFEFSACQIQVWKITVAPVCLFRDGTVYLPNVGQIHRALPTYWIIITLAGFDFDFQYRSRDNSVGIATGYGLDCRGSLPPQGSTFFSSTAFSPALGPIHPPI